MLNDIKIAVKCANEHYESMGEDWEELSSSEKQSYSDAFIAGFLVGLNKQRELNEKRRSNTIRN